MPTTPWKTTMTTSTPDTKLKRNHPDEILIGLVSISDRASTGVYEDKGIPALQEWLGAALSSPWQVVTRLIQDDAPTISATLTELVDEVGCDLVLTTGGTGPSRRDVTPEATLAVATKEMPGFGEQMRQISLNFVPTAILSRQVAVIRETADHAALIVNLPGQPKSIKETLEGLRDADAEAGGTVKVPGIFAAVPYCIDLIGGPYVETNAEVVKAFRPRSAVRAPGRLSLFRVEGGVRRRRNQEVLPVVLQFVDRLVNVGKRRMQRALLKTLVDCRLPASAQLLERADVEIAVMEEALQIRHPARHEAAVLADRIAAHRRLAGWHMCAEKIANLFGGIGFAHRRCLHAVDQSRPAVCVLIPLVHFGERLVALMNRQNRALDHSV